MKLPIELPTDVATLQTLLIAAELRNTRAELRNARKDDRI